MEKFDLNQNIFRLLRNEAFFAAISRTVAKIENLSIPTAGVCINPDTCYFELHYNSAFFENLGKTDENGIKIEDPSEIFIRKEIEILGILKHEFLHLCLEHLTSRLPSSVNPDSPWMIKLWNVATDLAINSDLFKELPYFACVPGREYIDPKTNLPGDFDFKSYPLGLTAEKYFVMLKQDPKIQEELNKIPETLDDHSMWDNKADNIVKNIAKNRLREMVKDACNAAIKNETGWGSISQEMQQKILATLNSKVDWKNILRYFVKTSQRSNRTSSMKKINKRYPYIYSGKKNSKVANVAISIDQSGSVTDKMLELFFSELNKLSEYATFTVVPFDDKVYEEKVYVWKKGEHRLKERILCGGTNFDAPTDYVNQRNFDGHIILTDLCAPKPKNSRIQRLWITTETNAKNPPFQIQERIIVIPND